MAPKACKHKWPDLSPPVPYYKPSFPAMAARCLRKGCREPAPVLPDIRLGAQVEHIHTWATPIHADVGGTFRWVQACTGCRALQVSS